MLPLPSLWLHRVLLAGGAVHGGPDHAPSPLILALMLAVAALPFCIEGAAALRPRPLPARPSVVTAQEVTIQLANGDDAVVGVHVLGLGARLEPWSDVRSIARDGGRLWIFLVRHRALVATPRTARGLDELEAACAEALRRAGTLTPLDPEAVDAVRRLGPKG